MFRQSTTASTRNREPEMKDRKIKFRSALAENGIELTPEQAARIYKMTGKIRRVARRLSTIDLWRLEGDESIGMPKEERVQIADLYRAAKEI